MAEVNPPGLNVCAVLSGTTFIYTMYHCYMFDGCRCLIPRFKDWHRVLLTWMLVSSSLLFLAWAAGWAYVKYSLGWVYLGPIKGARPWPSAMFVAPYDSFNKPLTTLLSLAFSFQASLNTQETLYWFHLMRSVRTPHRARAWIGSWPFYAWVVVSISISALQITVPWYHYDPMNLQYQLALELTVGGIIELCVVGAATYIVFKFPRFLHEVKASGAGPEVRTKLHFYNGIDGTEANKVRTLFRYAFAISTLIIGADGMTEDAPLNWNGFASDVIVAIIAGSFCIAVIISVMVYLPRTYGTAGTRVLVGQQAPPAPGQAASQFALITLLREGGWEGEGEDGEGGADGDDREDKMLRGASAAPGVGMGAGMRHRTSSGRDLERGEGGARGSAAGEEVFGNKDAAASSDWSLAKETREEDWTDRPALPAALQHFTSPIAPHVEVRPQGPVEIRVHVERQVHQD